MARQSRSCRISFMKPQRLTGCASVDTSGWPKSRRLQTATRSNSTAQTSIRSNSPNRLSSRPKTAAWWRSTGSRKSSSGPTNRECVSHRTFTRRSSLASAYSLFVTAQAVFIPNSFSPVRVQCYDSHTDAASHRSTFCVSLLPVLRDLARRKAEFFGSLAEKSGKKPAGRHAGKDRAKRLRHHHNLPHPQ